MRSQHQGGQWGLSQQVWGDELAANIIPVYTQHIICPWALFHTVNRIFCPGLSLHEAPGALTPPSPPSSAWLISPCKEKPNLPFLPACSPHAAPAGVTRTLRERPRRGRPTPRAGRNGTRFLLPPHPGRCRGGPARRPHRSHRPRERRLAARPGPTASLPDHGPHSRYRRPRATPRRPQHSRAPRILSMLDMAALRPGGGSGAEGPQTAGSPGPLSLGAVAALASGSPLPRPVTYGRAGAWRACAGGLVRRGGSGCGEKRVGNTKCSFL